MPMDHPTLVLKPSFGFVAGLQCFLWRNHRCLRRYHHRVVCHLWEAVSLIVGPVDLPATAAHE